MDYEKLKEQYLEKLEVTRSALTELPKYEKYNIFEDGDLKSLVSIKDKNDLYLSKLKNGEIEVAIVGMENTGKSTFANAFIKLKEAFPTGSVRTTFTSTKLKYGTEDKAVIEFFSESDFVSMFREMLSKIKYPNHGVTNINEMSVENYTKYFETLRDTNNDTYKANISTTHQDIKDILEGYSSIKRYLNNSIRSFTKQEIENEDLKKFITDKYIARSVKKVELELSQFEDTKEMVLYDVPGFNSTTEKHKIETRKSLNSADAIILIKNVISNSQITSEEKTMLNSYDENSGIKLSDKLFAYGTQVDRANNKEDAIEVSEKLEEDLQSNLDVNSTRLFIGSPFAYMQQLGFEKDDKSVKILTEWGMESYITSIEDMKMAIKGFYKNEAFKNIQRQINMNIQTLKTILSKVIIDTEDSNRLEKLNMQETGLIADFVVETQKKLENQLPDISEDIKKEILETEYFSNKLREKITGTFDKVTEEQLEEQNKKIGNIRDVFSTNIVNSKIRESKEPEILKQFVDITVNLSNDKAEEYQKKILDKLMQIFSVEQNNEYYEEIRNKLNLLVDNLTEKSKYRDTSYVYLIQRFSRDLISVVIGKDKGSSSRIDSFDKAIKEFTALAVYYEDIENLNNVSDYSLIRKVLNIKTDSIMDDATNEVIQYGFEEYKEFEEVVNTIKNNNISSDVAIQIIEEVRSRFKNIAEDNIKILVKKVMAKLDEYIEHNSVKPANSDSSSSIKNMYEKVKPSTNKAELLQEINSDIELLEDVLQTAVVKAINLEFPFSASFTDSINIMKNSEKEFREFTKEYFTKIKYKELSNTKEAKVALEEKKRAIDKIKELQISL